MLCQSGHDIHINTDTHPHSSIFWPASKVRRLYELSFWLKSSSFYKLFQCPVQIKAYNQAYNYILLCLNISSFLVLCSQWLAPWPCACRVRLKHPLLSSFCRCRPRTVVIMTVSCLLISKIDPWFSRVAVGTHDYAHLYLLAIL